MKRSSLLIAALAITVSAFAQDGRKPAPKAQEPVRVAPVTKDQPAEKVAVTGDKTSVAKTSATPAPAPAKKKLVKKNVVAKNKMQAAPVSSDKNK